MQAEIKLCLGPYTNPIYHAIKAETTQASPAKGEADVKIEENCLKLVIKSKDLSGLRALTNSYLLLIYAAYSSLKSI